MARIDVHEEVFDEIPTEHIMRRLGEGMVRDAKVYAAKRTGRAAESVELIYVSDTLVVFGASPLNPRSSREHANYGAHLERGTSDTRAQPFIRPAAYKYRTP